MAEMIDLARSSVQTWQSDQMGHMNVQFYLEQATQGLAALGLHLGLGPRFVAGEGARLFARDHHVRFLREQRPGAPFTIRGGVLDVRDFGMRVYLEMYNTVSEEIAASFAVDVELMDDETRETKPLPARAKAAAKAMIVDLPTHGAPRGLESIHPGWRLRSPKPRRWSLSSPGRAKCRQRNAIHKVILWRDISWGSCLTGFRTCLARHAAMTARRIRKSEVRRWSIVSTITPIPRLMTF